MNLDKDISSWGVVKADAVMRMSPAAIQNVLAMALHDIAILGMEYQKRGDHISALLGQLEGRPIKHPQQAAQREAARAAIT